MITSRSSCFFERLNKPAHSKASDEGGQHRGNAHSQATEMPRPCHAFLGQGVPLTATAGLGAADG